MPTKDSTIVRTTASDRRFPYTNSTYWITFSNFFIFVSAFTLFADQNHSH
ncbi:hypothetical protein KR50_33650 [Jeotgalibacillus campisalis]|uniref:Uncharacterized protein n=1 Tax=Jeotgalibacillus campisalis TaxID=220754 RepID=A0A0C2V1L6_9BACL|nr:hypothetical protein KR50_33650 [Jeotgalibacillus campisalis]